MQWFLSRAGGYQDHTQRMHQFGRHQQKPVQPGNQRRKFVQGWLGIFHWKKRWKKKKEEEEEKEEGKGGGGGEGGGVRSLENKKGEFTATVVNITTLLLPPERDTHGMHVRQVVMPVFG